MFPDGALRGRAIEVRSKESGALEIAGRRYRGSALVRLHPKEGLRVVNRVPLEDYLRGVIGAEIGASSPRAALEAQAIASRTYALRSGYEGPLPDGSSGQVYRGVAGESPRVDRAVERTRGLVLTWEGKPFSAFFHSTCGGSTTDASPIFGIPPLRPLSGVECGSCEGSRFSRWSVTIPRSTLDALTATLDAGRRFESLEILETEPDGRPRLLRWKGRSKTVEIPPSRLQSLFQARSRETVLRSAWIEAIEPVPDGIEIRGRGYGHGVGLCQVGAIRRARAGEGAEQILLHYYPGAEIVPLPPES